MDKTVGEVLMDNIEFSDAIVLVVRSSCISNTSDIEEATKLLLLMNPRAKIFIHEEKLPSSSAMSLLSDQSSSSENALTALLSGEPMYDVDRTGKELGWFNALQLSSEDNGNTTANTKNSSTIETFVYRARKPFDPARLWNLIHSHGWSLIRGGEIHGASTYQGQVDTQLSALDLNNSTIHQSSSSLLRAKGYIWLQGRDWIFGEWDQAGFSVSIEPGGPWFCVLPEHAWPESPEVREVALRDCQHEHGDKRQEIVFIGEECVLKGLKDALDSCLVSTYTSDDGGGGGATDDEKWFVGWPSLDELLGLDGGGNNNKEEDEEEHNMWIVSGGGTEVQEMLTAKASSTTTATNAVEVTVIHWLAPWVDTSNAAQQLLQQTLACRFPSVDFLILDVESSFGNSSLAYQKVLDLPAARRANARPVVKSGGKFPCFTVHYAPSLQPAATLSGSTAVEDLKKWLVQNVGEGEGLLTTILPRHPPNKYEDEDGDEDDDSLDLNGDHEKDDQDKDDDDAPIPIQHIHVLDLGAVQFKNHLKQSADTGRKAIVCWEERPASADNGDHDGYFKKRIENAPAAVRELLGSYYYVMVVYLTESTFSPNAVLAQAMKVKREKLPCIHVYEGMKLLERSLGQQKCSDLLVKLIREANSKKEEEVEKEEQGGDGGGVDPSSTAATTSGEEAAASGNEWNPPHAKYAKPGGTKRFKNGHLGFFFPKMPCLRCGCPWWSSEEWDARCLRCGWNCERSGYDDDSRPLEKYKGLWERFTREIAGGKTPEWKGK